MSVCVCVCGAVVCNRNFGLIRVARPFKNQKKNKNLSTRNVIIITIEIEIIIIFIYLFITYNACNN